MVKASKKPKTELLNSTGLIIPVSYFVLLGVNIIITALAGRLAPEAVVLGTASISRSWALIHSMGTLTLLNVFMIPLVHYHEEIRGKMYNTKEWMLSYLVINFVGLWVIARFADNLGLGLSAWWVALLLAVVLDWVQGLAMMTLSKLTA